MTIIEYDKIPEDQMEQLHTWLAKIPFSKPSKNLARDFSDAVLMAEILKVYYPRYVDLHNYVVANNYTTKKENWNILNRKVLSKIDMKLSKDIMDQLAHCYPGAIEHVLLELRSKLWKYSEHQNSLCNIKEKDPFVESSQALTSLATNEINHITLYSDERNEASSRKESLDPCSPNQLTPKTIVSGASMLTHVKSMILYAFYWILLFLCCPFIRFRSSRQLKRCRKGGKGAAPVSMRQDVSQNTNSDDVVPRQVCVQLKQELVEKDDIISTLNCKVAYLENAMRVKDLRISNLASQILQNAVESEQLTRNQTNATLAKLRPRTSIIREKIKVEE